MRVAVVGLGTMGSMTAWQLSKRGVDVIGFDQFAAPHDRGAHAGETRMLRTAYQEGTEYVPIILRARELWAELGSEAGKTIFSPTGYLTIGDGDFAKNALASIRAYDLPHQVFDHSEAERRYPQHRLSPDDIVILDRGGGLLRPELAVASALRLAETNGAELHPYTQVMATTVASGHVSVVTDKGTFEVDAVVQTTGAWATDSKLLPGSPVEATRIYIPWFPVSDPEMFTLDKFPVFSRKSAGMGDFPKGFGGFPAVDGFSIKVGSNTGVNGPVDPDELDRTIPPAVLTALNEAVGQSFNGVSPFPSRIGVYVDGYTPDVTPFVKFPTADDPVAAFVGFSGHGFKMAPAIGEAAADLITGKTPKFTLDSFDGKRFDIRASEPRDNWASPPNAGD